MGLNEVNPTAGEQETMGFAVLNPSYGLQGRGDDGGLPGPRYRGAGGRRSRSDPVSRRSIIDWLGDIIAWGEWLEHHIAGMSFEDFIKDAKTQDAASKCAESIGLAANELSRLDPALEREFPELQLSLAYRSRNKLSHGYYTIEQDIVWTTVTPSIPQTVAAARQAKREYERRS